MSFNLQFMRDKVRKLTRSPSINELTDASLDEALNTFILYDLPQELKLIELHKTFSFYTEPFVDVYDTNTILATAPLFDFKNAVININSPVYIAGQKSWYVQSREQFFNLYPPVQQELQIGSGDGATTLFGGTLSQAPVLQNKVVFSSIDANNESIVVVDIPQINPITGERRDIGDLVVPGTTVPIGTIFYSTGAYSLFFPIAPGPGMAVNAQVIGYTAGRPNSVLFYDNTFTLRPVPDKPYEVEVECYVPATEIISADTNSYSNLKQWSQYIAYGAAIKILQERHDLETVAQLMPEFKRQERFVLRRTLVQQATQRTSTIYADQTSLEAGFDNSFNGF